MNCEKCRHLLRALVDNKLDEPTAERVISHLVYCQSCETRFEDLLNGKEIYANLFSEIQPPSDLPAKFQVKLESEIRRAVTANSGFYQQLSKSLAFLCLEPILMAASVLILLALGFIFFGFVNHSDIADKTSPVPVTPEKPQIIRPQIEEIEPKEMASASPGEPENTKIINRKKVMEKQNPRLKLNYQPASKTINPSREVAAKANESGEDGENKIAQIQELEIDAARQLEKIEILFRAFRNAPLIEGTAQYDVDYEKRQARKLLINNDALKQRVERYGTLATGEMLNRVEPYLLDIANLDGNQSAEQVTKIKDRFRNQSIITSLQGF